MSHGSAVNLKSIKDNRQRGIQKNNRFVPPDYLKIANVNLFVPVNYGFLVPAESINLQILFSKTTQSSVVELTFGKFRVAKGNMPAVLQWEILESFSLLHQIAVQLTLEKFHVAKGNMPAPLCCSEKFSKASLLFNLLSKFIRELTFEAFWCLLVRAPCPLQVKILKNRNSLYQMTITPTFEKFRVAKGNMPAVLQSEILKSLLPTRFTIPNDRRADVLEIQLTFEQCHQ